VADIKHDPRVRTCIVLVGIPVSELRDDLRCPACDDLHRLHHLDPEVHEVLTREPWCEACVAGDKPFISQSANATPKCTRCGGTRTVNLGTRSDAEYWPCPDCKSDDLEPSA